MKIVLIGYMGSGKSAVGLNLSSKLKYNFRDLDQEIESFEGNSISRIFSDKGEIYFRKIENRIIKNIIDSEQKLILASGGGSPCYGDTMEYLVSKKKVVIIYLKASLETLLERLNKERQQRPMIAHIQSKEELNDFIRKHLFERSYYYNKALLTINVNELSISEISEAIILKLF